MVDRFVSEGLFLEHLGWINRVAGTTCMQHGVWGAEAEDCASFIRMKLMEDDYAIIRKHRGASTLKTYLAMVVTRHFHEYLRERRGRWRTSAAARRLGPPAPDLEALVHRDGYRLDQAGELLRTAGRTTLTDRELGRLLNEFPQREPLRPREVPPDAVLDGIEGGQHAEDRVAGARAEALHQQVMDALERAMGTLGPEDRMIVRMHMADGRSLADVSRALGVERKPLFRRVNRLRRHLRVEIENRLGGLSPQSILGLDALQAEDHESSQLHDFRHPGILGPDGLPITREELQGSRIITDLVSTNEKILKMVRKDPSSMYSLSPRQFEELVAELLHEQGYEIALTPPTNDGGFDMYAARKDGLGEFLYLVECKRYAPARPVGVDIVRALYGVVQRMHANAGVIVTTSRFTKGAEAFQKTVRYQLSLRDYLHLQQWLG